jgi:serine/threonine protein phosphatase PrpC
VKLIRQIFKRESKPEYKPEEIYMPESSDLDADIVRPAPAADAVPAVDDTIPPMAPPRPDESLDDESTLVGKPPAKPRATREALKIGYGTHVGRVRKRNEDSALVITATTLGESALAPYGLFVVADGMGGHSEGQRASQLAARIVGRDVMSQIFPPFLHIDNSEPPQPVQSILESSLQAANWEVQAGNPESGTTLTAALILGERLFVAHVGDSRAYMIQDEDSPAERLTLDHSFVQRLQDTGQITAEEAATHPQRNILYRAIGQGDRLDVDTFSRPIPKPSWLVLCSDGLWGEVADESIKASVTSAATPQHACDEMIEAALEAGGPDNITVIVIQFE